jgi:hypothetical protein
MFYFIIFLVMDKLGFPLIFILNILSIWFQKGLKYDQSIEKSFLELCIQHASWKN